MLSLTGSPERKEFPVSDNFLWTAHKGNFLPLQEEENFNFFCFSESIFTSFLLKSILLIKQNYQAILFTHG